MNGMGRMGRSREAERQQLLLSAISRSTAPAALASWAGGGLRMGRGLQVYQANAGALAERALAAAYPVVAQVLGPESLARLARALWRQQPPLQGDVATWGAGLAQFLADADASADADADADAEGDANANDNDNGNDNDSDNGPCLSGLPYLPDVARLDWAVHLAASAADAATAPGAFECLADTDPAGLWLQPRPGTALLQSLHPVASIWSAHQEEMAANVERFADPRAALARGQGEAALVWRHGWRVRVAALDDGDAAFTRRLLQGASLAQALDTVDALGAVHDRPSFDFKTWLATSLTRGWLLGASAVRAGTF